MSKTILLADDSVTIRKVVELTLMDGAYELISVGSGDAALERLDGQIDLVIADVHMPGADGYEVCRAFKERAGTPVLLLVGTFESYDEARAEAAGADDHLKKPFDSQDLLSRVHTLLANAEETPDGEAASAVEPAIEGPAAVEPAPSTASSVTAETPSAEEGSDQRPENRSQADGGAPHELSDETVDRIAKRVIELLSEEAVRDVAWEVIPDLAEVVIKERLDELESQVE